MSYSLAAEVDKKENTKKYKQWFAGPLFVPNPTTVDPKHPGIEPAIIFSNTYGHYDQFGDLYFTPHTLSIIPYMDLQIGITKKIGIEIIALLTTNFSQDAASTHLKDTILRIGYQISNDKSNSWIPDFRILLQETLPTGKYHKLNVQKRGTDSTGEGSYQTGFHLVAQKLYTGKHPLRIRADFGYFFPSPVKICGISHYGGHLTTKGTVYPGQHYTIFLFGEYALSRTWAIACELNYLSHKKGRFSSKTTDTLKVPSSHQLVIYPELQRTLSSSTALIFGSAFTLTGTNAPAYFSLSLALLHIF